MKLITSFKKLSPVIFLIVSLVVEAGRSQSASSKTNSTSAAATTQGAQSKEAAKTPAAVTYTAEDPAAANAKAKADIENRVRDLHEGWRKECDQKTKESTDVRAQFLLVCKAEQRKEISKAGSASEARADVIKKCSEDFDKCLERGKDDLDIPGMTSSMPGMEAFSSFNDALGDLKDEEKRCSQYSSSDYKSALEKAESSLETKNKKIEDLTEKLTSSQEKGQEDFERLQKEFDEAQQKKTKSDLERKENSRNQKAAYEKQIQEYKSKVDQLNIEIAQLQEQMVLQLRNKGAEVDAFKLELLGCKEQARMGNRGSGSQGQQQAANSAPQSNLLGATHSTSKQIYQICAGNAVRKRQIAAQEFNSKIKLLQMNIDLKMKQLNSIQESAASFQDMYNRSMADQQSAQTAEDQAFLSNQSKAWQNLQSRVSQLQSKNMQNQSFLQKANTDMNKAAKKVAALEGETPPPGKKSADEIKEAMAKYESIEKNLANICDKAKKNFSEVLKEQTATQ